MEQSRAKYKALLEEELLKLQGELTTVGRINPENPADWQAKPAQMDTLVADENELADTLEAFEENSAILEQLEIQINDVKRALKKIDAGTYGICEITGEQIEEARLDANPAARTCLAHKDSHLSHDAS